MSVIVITLVAKFLQPFAIPSLQLMLHPKHCRTKLGTWHTRRHLTVEAGIAKIEVGGEKLTMQEVGSVSSKIEDKSLQQL